MLLKDSKNSFPNDSSWWDDYQEPVKMDILVKKKNKTKNFDESALSQKTMLCLPPPCPALDPL